MTPTLPWVRSLHQSRGGSVERYQTADLASGQRAEVQLAGDVVLAATGVELDALDTPPTPPSGKSR